MRRLSVFSRVPLEKLMTKDAKLRTFITADADREELVALVYDTTYGIIKRKDTLVVLDDSIVRGTTLREHFADSRPLKDEEDYRGLLGSSNSLSGLLWD